MVAETTGAWDKSAVHVLHIIAAAVAAREGATVAELHQRLLQELWVTARRFRAQAALRRRAELTSQMPPLSRASAVLLESWELLRILSYAVAIDLWEPGVDFPFHLLRCHSLCSVHAVAFFELSSVVAGPQVIFRAWPLTFGTVPSFVALPPAGRSVPTLFSVLLSWHIAPFLSFLPQGVRKLSRNYQVI